MLKLGLVYRSILLLYLVCVLCKHAYINFSPWLAHLIIQEYLKGACFILEC
jgi:hypothetical protein